MQCTGYLTPNSVLLSVFITKPTPSIGIYISVLDITKVTEATLLVVQVVNVTCDTVVFYAALTAMTRLARIPIHNKANHKK